MARLSELAGNCVVPHVPDVLQVNSLAAMVTFHPWLVPRLSVTTQGVMLAVLVCGTPVSVVAGKSPAAKGVV